MYMYVCMYKCVCACHIVCVCVSACLRADKISRCWIKAAPSFGEQTRVTTHRSRVSCVRSRPHAVVA